MVSIILMHDTENVIKGRELGEFLFERFILPLVDGSVLIHGIRKIIKIENSMQQKVSSVHKSYNSIGKPYLIRGIYIGNIV